MGKDSDEFEEDIGKFERQLQMRMSSSPAGVSSKSNIKFGMIPDESSSDDGGTFEDIKMSKGLQRAQETDAYAKKIDLLEYKLAARERDLEQHKSMVEMLRQASGHCSYFCLPWTTPRFFFLLVPILYH